MSHLFRPRVCKPFSNSAEKSRCIATAYHASHQVRLIGGIWKRTRLPVLNLAELRPTPALVRETLFNWLGQKLDGLVCLDLFAGTGALGFEAASRGAQCVIMIERDARAAKQLNAIQKKLDAQTIKIVQADALRLAARLTPAAFDIVFLDPPFNISLLGRMLTLVLPLVAPGGVIYVESGTPLATIWDAQAQQRFAAVPYRLLPQDWCIVRQSRAGAVHFHLLKQENSH
ncbi:16S rRNA (guanine(966)-N(2))-methyltransferase RsmD [Candidatus Vallotia cooleyia]|uniref:16S rRNA (guanine(966)-N(2))-methyltransferase RsmD n=1 Tax=Candidatus Vallotiella adelgis TaxID=1177211 RepID=UPI001D00E489|nr:16S rRNA (guanine(966)-N(2))-methyltransferase RsmD [Candidatus Vallotia cooleyia]UDG82532.1 Ribosomal RNA small subunit methyltransferase D [Candidatus Vallotia cooleyia]